MKETLVLISSLLSSLLIPATEGGKCSATYYYYNCIESSLGSTKFCSRVEDKDQRFTYDCSGDWYTTCHNSEPVVVTDIKSDDYSNCGISSKNLDALADVVQCFLSECYYSHQSDMCVSLGANQNVFYTYDYTDDDPCKGNKSPDSSSIMKQVLAVAAAFVGMAGLVWAI